MSRRGDSFVQVLYPYFLLSVLDGGKLEANAGVDEVTISPCPVHRDQTLYETNDESSLASLSESL